jgi:hypothetical protein
MHFAERFDRHCGRLPHAVSIRNIARDPANPRAVPSEPVRSRLYPMSILVRDDHVHALLEQSSRQRESKPAAAARHERRSSREFTHFYNVSF